jgi:hypothetical protein
VLEDFEFVASSADAALFRGTVDGETIWLLVWVDDILVAAQGEERVAKVKAHLTTKFDMRDLGPTTYFLGMELSHDREARSLKLTQKKLTGELISQYGLVDACARLVPQAVGEKFRKEGEPLDTVRFPYSECVGSLLYLSVCTRLDIAQAVGALARYMAAPTVEHWEATLGVVRYLVGIADYGLTFGGSSETLVGYCDADYTGDQDSIRSTTGYVFLMFGGAVSWSSRLQPTVAVSTVEAEYLSAGHAVKEALWFRELGADLVFNLGHVQIYYDNQGAIQLLKHPIASQRSKHIDVIHHFARERVARKEINFVFCRTEDMKADILTKALAPGKFKKCRNEIGIE